MSNRGLRLIGVPIYAVTCVIFLLASVMARADYTWRGGNNSDLSNSSNWTGSEGKYLFPSSVSGIYLSQDWTIAAAMMTSSDNTKLSFDLGAEKTLNLSGGTIAFFNSNNSTIEFLSGKIEAASGTQVNLLSNTEWGNQRHNNTFRLKGANTYFDGRAADVMFSFHGSGNTFEIADGAKYYGRFRFGNNNPWNQTLYIHDGAEFACSGNFENQQTPTKDSLFKTIVSNATFLCTNIWTASNGKQTHGYILLKTSANLHFGLYDESFLKTHDFYLRRPGAGYSKLVVSNSEFNVSYYAATDVGSEAVFAGPKTKANILYELQIGGRGSGCSNKVTVTDNAILEIPFAYSGSRSIIAGYSGYENELVISGGAVVSNSSTSTPYVGCEAGARGNKITIDGGKLYSERGIAIGGNTSSLSNSIIVANGGSFVSGTTYYCQTKIGDAGSFNTLEIGNEGLVELYASRGWSGRAGNGTDNTYIGYGNGASCNVLSVLEGGVLTSPVSGSTNPDSYSFGTKLNVGFSANSSSNRLEVLGGTVRCGNIYVGGTNETSVCNSLVVDDGTILASGMFVCDRKYLTNGEAFADVNTLSIKGTSSKINLANNASFADKAELALDFSDGVYSEIPLTAKTAVFEEGSSVSITNVKNIRKAGGATVTIASTTSGITFADGLLEEWNASLSENHETEGCTFALKDNNKKLVLTIPIASGLTVIVR